MLKDCATCRFENNKGNNLYLCNRCIRGNFSSSVFPDQWYPFDQREEQLSEPSPSLWDIKSEEVITNLMPFSPLSFSSETPFRITKQQLSGASSGMIIPLERAEKIWKKSNMK